MKQILLSLLVTTFATQFTYAQSCVTTGNFGSPCTPRSNFFYGELAPYTGIGGEVTVTSYGPGQYFRMPVLEGGCYTISTCGNPVNTQLTLYEANETTTPFAWREEGGLECSGTAASITFSPSFTDYARVDLREYDCQPGGSQSIEVTVRQNDNLDFTNSMADMCEGETRVLTPYPAPVTGTPQPNSGDPGTIWCSEPTAISGNVFTAPTPVNNNNLQTFTIYYQFGKFQHHEFITVHRETIQPYAGEDQTVCTSSTTLPGVYNAYGVGTWDIISGPGTVTNVNIANSTITGLVDGQSTTLTWSYTNGACSTKSDTVVITRDDITPPSITCPGLQYATVDSFCNNSLADYTGLASASDLCGAVTVTQSPAPGTTINGTTEVTLTAQDESGNLDSCSFTVKLAPTITHFTGKTDSQWRVRWEYSAATPNDTNFRIRYWEQGFPLASTDRSQFPGNFQKKITALEPYTWYKVKIGFACGNGDFIWGDVDSVRTKKVICPTPAGNAQDLPMALNSASVSWDDQGATSYKFKHREVGETSWDYQTVVDPNRTINGLTPGTTYEYQVKALCPTGLWSAYTGNANFMTAVPGVQEDGSARLAAGGQSAEHFSMNLFPNPSSGQITINLEGKLSNTVIEIRDMTLRLIRSIDLQNSDYAVIDLSDIPTGMYHVTAFNEGRQLAEEKLVIN